MTLVAPDLDELAAEAAPVELTFDQALELRRDLHRANARMLRRSPPGRPLDWADARAAQRIDAEWLALPEELRERVDYAFRVDHPCDELATCPWGRE